jgi:hypothetical protein
MANRNVTCIHIVRFKNYVLSRHTVGSIAIAVTVNRMYISYL